MTHLIGLNRIGCLVVLAILFVGCEKKSSYSKCTGAAGCAVCSNCTRCGWCKAHRDQPCGVKISKRATR